jgi:hypothetical protein
MGAERDFDTAETLLAYAGELGLRAALLAQVRKDFERASVPFPKVSPGSKGEGTDREWVRGLEESLYRLLMEHFDGYLNLMYAADVPEREFRSLQLTDAVDVARQVVVLLLRREWQKVWIRATYDSGGPPQK